MKANRVILQFNFETFLKSFMRYDFYKQKTFYELFDQNIKRIYLFWEMQINLIVFSNARAWITYVQT